MNRKAAAWLHAPLVTALALGCMDGAGGGGEVEDGALRGELERLVADRDDGTSETFYFLRLADGSDRRLAFARDPHLAPYTPLAVWGGPDGTAPDAPLAVSRYRVELDDPPAPAWAAPASPAARAALVDAERAAPRRFAFVLVDTGAGVNLSVEAARQRLFDADLFVQNLGSIRRYYREASYGVQDLAGDVFGPIAYTPIVPCDTRGVTTLRDDVDALAGGPSDHYLWYFGSRQTACNFSGLAAQGTPDRPARDTWYNASSGCVVLVQEPGHNLGMQHSSALECPGASFVDEPEGICAHNEYGDPFDPMGSGCRHMNAWQKTYQGWLSGCNGVRVTASGTFTLFPIESACNGIQVLQVPMPHPRRFTHAGGGAPASTDTLTSYTVELRAPTGFDDGLDPMVLVHVAGDLPDRFRNGQHTWLLDMTPETSSLRDAALRAGRTFTDPAGGLSITVVAADATRATISVEIAGGDGAPTCFDGTTTLAPPGPQRCDEPAPGGGATGGGARGGGETQPDPGRTGAGTGDALAGNGCGCAAGGAPSRAPLAVAVILAAAAALASRRRRR